MDRMDWVDVTDAERRGADVPRERRHSCGAVDGQDRLLVALNREADTLFEEARSMQHLAEAISEIALQVRVELNGPRGRE